MKSIVLSLFIVLTSFITNLVFAKCLVTEQDTEGPFFVSNIPMQKILNKWNAKGKKLFITGTVYDGESLQTPLAGVKVEIWHTDKNGDYHPNAGGDYQQYNPKKINLRGTTVTDSSGKFEFETIVPGGYFFRRKHLHWKLSKKDYKTLTTQTFWHQDKRPKSPERKGEEPEVPIQSCRWVHYNKVDSMEAGEVNFGLLPAE